MVASQLLPPNIGHMTYKNIIAFSILSFEFVSTFLNFSLHLLIVQFFSTILVLKQYQPIQYYPHTFQPSPFMSIYITLWFFLFTILFITHQQVIPLPSSTKTLPGQKLSISNKYQLYITQLDIAINQQNIIDFNAILRVMKSDSDFDCQTIIEILWQNERSLKRKLLLKEINIKGLHDLKSQSLETIKMTELEINQVQQKLESTQKRMEEKENQLNQNLDIYFSLPLDLIKLEQRVIDKNKEQKQLFEQIEAINLQTKEEYQRLTQLLEERQNLFEDMQKKKRQISKLRRDRGLIQFNLISNRVLNKDITESLNDKKQQLQAIERQNQSFYQQLDRIKVQIKQTEATVEKLNRQINQSTVKRQAMSGQIGTHLNEINDINARKQKSLAESEKIIHFTLNEMQTKVSQTVAQTMTLCGTKLPQENPVVVYMNNLYGIEQQVEGLPSQLNFSSVKLANEYKNDENTCSSPSQIQKGMGIIQKIEENILTVKNHNQLILLQQISCSYLQISSHSPIPSLGNSIAYAAVPQNGIYHIYWATIW